jgi:cytochrome b561
MRTERDGFSGLQRVLHWLMAVMVLTMLFIGVSMVSTLKPRFLTLIAIHKPLGIAILASAALRLAVRSRLGAPHCLTIYHGFKRWQQSSRTLCSMRS